MPYNVIVDPRVNFKCRVPLCENYGRSHITPEGDGREEFAKVLARYSFAILVKMPSRPWAGPDRRNWPTSRCAGSARSSPSWSGTPCSWGTASPRDWAEAPALCARSAARCMMSTACTNRAGRPWRPGDGRHQDRGGRRDAYRHSRPRTPTSGPACCCWTDRCSRPGRKRIYSCLTHVS